MAKGKSKGTIYVKSHYRNGKMVRAYTRGGGSSIGGARGATALGRGTASRKAVIPPKKSVAQGTGKFTKGGHEIVKMRSGTNTLARHLMEANNLKPKSFGDYRNVIKGAKTWENTGKRPKTGSNYGTVKSTAGYSAYTYKGGRRSTANLRVRDAIAQTGKSGVGKSLSFGEMRKMVKAGSLMAQKYDRPVMMSKGKNSIQSQKNAVAMNTLSERGRKAMRYNHTARLLPTRKRGK